MTTDRHEWMRTLVKLALEQGWSPAGRRIRADAPLTATDLKPGDLVRVRRPCPGDLVEHAGALGYLIGFTVPHGFAVVDLGSEEVTFHPENLEAAP